MSKQKYQMFSINQKVFTPVLSSEIRVTNQLYLEISLNTSTAKASYFPSAPPSALVDQLQYLTNTALPTLDPHNCMAGIAMSSKLVHNSSVLVYTCFGTGATTNLNNMIIQGKTPRSLIVSLYHPKHRLTTQTEVLAFVKTLGNQVFTYCHQQHCCSSSWFLTGHLNFSLAQIKKGHRSCCLLPQTQQPHHSEIFPYTLRV